MKKLLCCFIILCLSVCSFSTIQAVEVENDNVDIMAVAAAMYIKGETSLKFSVVTQGRLTNCSMLLVVLNLDGVL